VAGAEGGIARGGFTPLRSIKAWNLLLLVGLAAGPAWAAPRPVLVVHSTEAKGDWAVPALVNLLGHFGCTVTALPARAYTPDEIDRYGAVIYLGVRSETLPRALLDDLYDTALPICWVGNNLEQLADRFSLGRYGFRLTGRQVKCDAVIYRGQSLAPALREITEIAVDRPDLCETLAMGGAAPYAVRSGGLWYLPEMPLVGVGETGSWLVLADQLHAVIGETHPPRRTALVCITGVSPLSDDGKVRTLVTLLATQRVTPAIAVTPLHRDPSSNRDIRLYERDDVAAALRSAQRNGAAILAHGLTHQSAARTGEEAEFWDEARHGPLLERSSEDTHRRVDQAINELAACELYAVAWATPRGLAAPADYAEMAQNFSTVWERRLPHPAAPVSQLFPFLIFRDSNGQQIVPESRLTLGKGDRAEALLKQARPFEAVCDPWVSFAITPEASPREVARLVSELRRAGWQFADLRRLDNWVKSTPLQIYTRARSVALRQVVPVGWNATLFLPDGSRDRRFEHAAKEGLSANETVQPRAILVAYPPGVDIDATFIVGGPMRRFTHGLVVDITRTVTLFAIGACVLFLLLYMAQIAFQRRRG